MWMDCLVQKPRTAAGALFSSVFLTASGIPASPKRFKVKIDNLLSLAVEKLPDSILQAFERQGDE